MNFAYSQEIKYTYPEPDLLDSLVSLYFEKSHIYLPVLHQPTFVRSLQSGLHLRDPSFGMTVLLVCAVASRYSSDIRVLLDEDTVGLSSGWKYFSQVPVFRQSLFHRSTIYDLQYYTVSYPNFLTMSSILMIIVSSQSYTSSGRQYPMFHG